MKKILLLTALVLTSNLAVFAKEECKSITKQQVLEAQKDWGNAIVAIGKAKDHKAEATNVLNTLYAFNMGTVLFKPTLAAQDQFRGTKDEALSYFVGGSNPEDKGFALAPFTNVKFENEGIILHCDTALAMGNYLFTKTDGSVIKVEYSFGYVKDSKGKLRIELHHSSIPYKPED